MIDQGQFRVLTVNREFGSGGGRIAQSIARRLGWKLLDRGIIDAIAYAAHVDSNVVRTYDEHVESWLRRINRGAMRSAALAAGLELKPDSVFDADQIVKLTASIVEQASAEGNCVIVGRGAQCILQHKRDTFHAFIYAPYRERILRLRTRLEKGADIEQRIRTVDGERTKYLQQYFGKCWNDPHLYDLMISSMRGEDSVARMIIYAMTGHPISASEMAAGSFAASN